MLYESIFFKFLDLQMLYSCYGKPVSRQKKIVENLHRIYDIVVFGVGRREMDL